MISQSSPTFCAKRRPIVDVLRPFGAPKLIAIAAIERAVEGDRPIAQRTILNRGLQVVPKAAETRRLRRLSLGGLGGREVGRFRRTADCPHDQHGTNQLDYAASRY